MKITNKNRQIWQDLFEAAIAFRDQKSWTWLRDSDLFGVKDPNSDLIGYCCIMGRLGEVFALGVYLGDKGFQSYINLATADDLEHLDEMTIGLEQYMLKVEFVDNRETDKVDKAAYKALGLKFRGRNQYVQIREMSPGFYPWHISDEQAIFLTHVLKQALKVAERAKDNSHVIKAYDSDLLIRIPKKKENHLVWTSTYQEEPEYDMVEEDRTINPFLLKRLKTLKRENTAICFSYFYMPGAVSDDNKRPFFSKIALWIVYGSGMIIGTAIFHPDDPIEKMDEAFVKRFEEIGIIPSQLIVDTETAEDAAFPITEALDIELVFAPEEEAFEAVQMFLKMGKNFM